MMQTRQLRRPMRMASFLLALGMAVGACGTAPGGDSSNVVTTDLSEVLPEGLFDALENIANPPVAPTPDPDPGASEQDIFATLIPAQADTDEELSEEELLRLRDEAFVDFSRCIRDEGFPDFPDIDSSQIVDQASFLRAMQEAGVSFTQPGLAPALQTCASVFSELIALAPQQDTNVQQVEQEENAVAFSQCMRDQGLDEFPDPDFGQYPNTGFPGQGDGSGVTPEIQAALRVCLPVFGGAEPNEAAAPPPPDDPTPAAQATVATPQSTSNTPSSSTSTQAPQPAAEGSAPVPGPTVSASVLRDTEELNTVEVVRRDLIDTEEFSGTLGYGDPEPLHTNTSGVVTGRLPEEGDVLNVGDVLFEVNSYPVVLLRGRRPMYRPFVRQMDNGPDVQQLEQALVDMGIPDQMTWT